MGEMIWKKSKHKWSLRARVGKQS